MRATNIDEKVDPNYPPYFIPEAEKSLKQAFVMGAVQAPDAEHLEQDGPHSCFIGLYITPAKYHHSPELTAARRSQDMSVRAGRAGAGPTILRDLSHLLSQDYHTLSAVRGAPLGDQGKIRLMTAMPFAMAASGGTVIVDSRLDDLYKDLMVSPTLRRILASTVAESALKDISDLIEIFQARAKLVSRRFLSPSISNLGEDSAEAATPVLVRARNKIKAAQMLIEDHLPPCQVAAELMYQQHSPELIKTKAFGDLHNIALAQLANPQMLFKRLLGASAVSLGFEQEQSGGDDAQILINAYRRFVNRMEMPIRPIEGLLPGNIYCQTGISAVPSELKQLLIDPTVPTPSFSNNISGEEIAANRSSRAAHGSMHRVYWQDDLPRTLQSRLQSDNHEENEAEALPKPENYDLFFAVARPDIETVDTYQHAHTPSHPSTQSEISNQRSAVTRESIETVQFSREPNGSSDAQDAQSRNTPNYDLFSALEHPANLEYGERQAPELKARIQEMDSPVLLLDTKSKGTLQTIPTEPVVPDPSENQEESDCVAEDPFCSF